MKPWRIETTTQFEVARRWYEKKRPAELAAVLNNLGRYFSLLNNAINAACVQAGYLHHEPQGIVALDQKGGKPNLQETRFYLYPHQRTQVVYLITIGNKSEQHDDILLAKRFVDSLTGAP